MTKDEFGNLLRNYRESCKDPFFPSRRLSQERFGELLGTELGTSGYSGAAVSDWERGESRIYVDKRVVLMAFLKVLYANGGLKTAEQANQLLEAGNYRALDHKETQQIFGIDQDDSVDEELVSKEQMPKSSNLSMMEHFLAVSENEFKVLIDKAKRDGPDPWWPRVLAALMRKATDRFSLSLRTVLWVWIWLMACWLIGPSLRLSFADHDAMLLAMQKYVSGSLIVPLMLGLLINTKDSEYWRLQAGVDPLLLRLYTYQGAGIGFNLGYFFVFPLSLLRHYLQLEPGVWIELLAATLGLILGTMGARVVPHNLWRAFGRLTWADGAIFFVVALMGPLWAFFFLEFYPVLLNPVTGILVFLLAITIMVFLATRKSKNYDK